MKIKRLFLDVETSKMVLAGFSLYEKYTPITNILEDWYIICAAWKWQGDNVINSAVTYNKNDKNIVKKLRNVILKADEIVYHNGNKFDYKKINARVVLNDLPPMKKPRETDTLLQCKKHFGFTSNKLDYIARALGFGGKIKTDDELWLQCLAGKKEAINTMLEYNKYDVVLLEKVFDRLAPHIDVGFNMNLATQNGDVCSNCGSENLHSRGYDYTKTCKYRRYHCQDCGHWPRSGKKEPRDTPIR